MTELGSPPLLSAIEPREGCCSPIQPLRWDDQQVLGLTTIFKALGHPVRLQVMEILSRQGGEVCVCDVESHFDLSQPTISHHLRVLRKAGLVDSEQRGTWIYYFVRDEAVTWVQSTLAEIASTA